MGQGRHAIGKRFVFLSHARNLVWQTSGDDGECSSYVDPAGASVTTSSYCGTARRYVMLAVSVSENPADGFHLYAVVEANYRDWPTLAINGNQLIVTHKNGESPSTRCTICNPVVRSPTMLPSRTKAKPRRRQAHTRSPCRAGTLALLLLSVQATLAPSPVWGQEGPPEQAADPALRLPEPEPLPLERLEERGVSPRYYREPKAYRGADLRLAGGARTTLNSDPSVAFTADALLEGRIGVGRGESHWGIWPELGYSLTKPSSGVVHQVVGGAGVGWQNWQLQYGVIPRLVVQTSGEVGVRTGFLVELWRGALGFELAHQVIWMTEAPAHEVRLTISVALIQAIAGEEGGHL